MEFRETTQEDVEFLANNSVSRGIAKYQPECIDYSFTLEHKGDILGIGGFRFINRTTAWAWLDMTHLAGAHMIVGFRVIKEWVDIFVKEHGIKRLQAYVECDFPEAVRMAEHLGLKRESTMENFMGDKDAFMYVKVI